MGGVMVQNKAAHFYRSRCSNLPDWCWQAKRRPRIRSQSRLATTWRLFLRSVVTWKTMKWTSVPQHSLSSRLPGQSARTYANDVTTVIFVINDVTSITSDWGRSKKNLIPNRILWLFSFPWPKWINNSKVWFFTVHFFTVLHVTIRNLVQIPPHNRSVH